MISGKKKKKLNCWQFKKCGREAGGHKAKTEGICPTTTATTLNGINGGINGGRVCWLVSGTYGKYKAEYASCISVKGIRSCYDCDFHKMVLADEGFVLTDNWINKKMKKLPSDFSL